MQFKSGTSSKTRIETVTQNFLLVIENLVEVVLPVKQGLKPNLYLSPYRFKKVEVVLPVKQGLKLHNSIIRESYDTC